ncbi:unnamed protein product [Mucor hiemalis]
MSLADCHSFHDCPLRSSSLLIVNKEKQTIVTATDEIFDILGYEPTQLVGRSVNILDPRRKYYKDEEGKKKERFTLRHESFGQIPVEICIHHDPLTNATDLDYWLIRPLSTVLGGGLAPTASLPITILRLSPFGTIEHAYPSTQFPQQLQELKGRPIMSFVHESDVRPLCEKLCNIKKRIHHTFRIRWLRLFHPQEEHTEDDFDWVTFTIMNSPRRLSCDAAYDPQSRPICIIRPAAAVTEEKSNQHKLQQQQCASLMSFSTPYLLTGLVSGTIKLLWDGTSIGVNQFLQIMEAMHDALDSGRTYLIEFLGHLLMHALKMVNEVIYFSSLDEYMNEDDMKKTNKKEEKKNKYHLYGLSTVKVDVDNSVWSVPLYIKKTIKSNYLTAESLFTRNNNKQQE